MPELRRFARLLLMFAAKSTSSASAHLPWKCEDLTPDTCELHVTSGSLEIKSIPVRYWRYTSPSPSTNDDIKHSIVILHGGPSFTHSYLLPLKQLACRGAEVIFYDQAGCGSSSYRNISLEEHPHLLDPAYYSEHELPRLIEHWNITKYHILGHSWGTMLAQLFALNSANKLEDAELQSIILSGPLSDSKSYIEAQWDEREGNLGSLPPFVQKRIHSLEADSDYESEEYQTLNDVLTTFFTLRTAPAPDCFLEALDGVNKQIYDGMQGPSEFQMAGTLSDFNVTGRLHEIDVPVLLTAGKYDTMRPSIVETMQQQMAFSESIEFPHSGHVSMIDDAGLMNDAIADFLKRVENSGKNFMPTQSAGPSEENHMNRSKPSPHWLLMLFTSCLAFALGILYEKKSNRYAYSLVP